MIELYVPGFYEKGVLCMKKILYEARDLLFLVLVCIFVSSCSGGAADVTTEADAGAVLGEHSWGEWQITREATLEKSGERERKCTDCEEHETQEYSVNLADAGVESISLSGGKYVIDAKYDGNSVVIRTVCEDISKLDELAFYIHARGASELVEGQAYRVGVDPDQKKLSVKVYKSRKFETASSLSGASVGTSDNTVEVKIPCAALGSTAKSCELAFFPEFKVSGATVSYSSKNAYVVSKYAETWLCVNRDNKIYYKDVYRNRNIKDWEKPSYTDHEVMMNAGIKESTVEEAIIAIAIAESKGAKGFTLRLEYLYEAGAASARNIEKITHSTSYPILALFYDGSRTQKVRLDTLLLAAKNGAAAVDLQGFMGHSGSTSTTQTPQNRKYWEDQGFDMSFIDAMPAETPISAAAVNSQKDFIDKVHAAGSEVLISAHVSASFSAKQALAYAEFCAARGVDVVKIVGIGQNKLDVAECVVACGMFGQSEKLKDVKVTYHLSGAPCAYITRVLCPIFYGSYIFFCYPELTVWQDANQLDLDMAVAANAARTKTNGKTVTIDEAIALVLAETNHEQLGKLVSNYTSGYTKQGYIYGVSSLVDRQWSFSGNKYVAEIRASGNKNNYTSRSHAYDPQNDNSGSISASVSGSYQPYVSGTRQPRVGVFLGNGGQMLAFTYNTSTNKLELCALRDGWYFGASCHDPSKTDALFSLGLAPSTVYKTNVASGGTVKLGMQLTDSTLELYFAEGSAKLQKVAEIPLSTVGKYIPETECHAGVLSEIYMGSESAGNKNTVTFSDVSCAKIG